MGGRDASNKSLSEKEQVINREPSANSLTRIIPEEAGAENSSKTNDLSNKLFQLAVRFVNETGKHLFLTGKAGTGKTTFLKYIRENSFKKMAVIAPTGVAAINAGGVTMHSFFQLPFGPFIPTQHSGWNADTAITDLHSLFKNIRFNAEKRKLLQELEMLVIDEVSMLRADMLDAMDLILRHFRQQPLMPFGGIQMIFIGDLFQLPPVVNNEEWEILKNYYKSPFFFDALCFQQSPPLYLELKKIYRQSESGFISILNNIRNNQASAADLDRLHTYYHPEFQPTASDNFIILTSHNAKADAINRKELEKLHAKLFSFSGEITGDFNEKALPADITLQLKEGAQIMFLKNDKGEKRRYYNGRIGQIIRIKDKAIFVRFPGQGEDIEIEKETWKNIRYLFNHEKNKVEEEELGTFTQYPIRLAWAITIHKSQGLTFEKAIIDAGASFAAGQVYVALSRLTSLEGLVLHSRIQRDSICTDERVLQFTRNEKDETGLRSLLEEEQSIFLTRQLVQSFDWSKVLTALTSLIEGYSDKMFPGRDAAIKWARDLLADTLQLQEVAAKFRRQLDQLLAIAGAEDFTLLHNRTAAAAKYFKEALVKITGSTAAHTNVYAPRQRVKKYIAELDQLSRLLMNKDQEFTQAVQIAEILMNGGDMSPFFADLQKNTAGSASSEENNSSAPNPAKEKKGTTKRISLNLFNEGKTITEIAEVRGLAASTVESHLASFLKTGEISIQQLVSEEKINAIQKAMEENPSSGIYALKAMLADTISFGEIRAVTAAPR
ncbi:MAG: helix-turn-helix domain-containing protein [Flavitalea sp.]